MSSLGKIKYLFLAFLVGFAYLEIEILGTRLIAPVYGTTIYVWTSLITITLVGLAVGYWIGGRLADKGKIGEGGLQLILLSIGAYIFFLPQISRFIIKNLFFYFSITTGPLIISAIIFFIPFALMAAVIPVLVKLATRGMEEIGRQVGAISAAETVGSLAGGLLAGYYIVLNFGIVTTALATGLFFILAAILAGFRKKLLPFLLIALLFPLAIPKIPAIVTYSDTGYYSNIKVVDEVYGRYEVRQLVLDNAVQSVLTNDPNYFNYINFFRIPFYYNPKISSVLMIGLGGGLGVQMLGKEYGVNIETVEIDPKVKAVAEQYFGFNSSKFPVIINDGRNYLLNTKKKYDLIILDIAFVDWVPYMYTTDFYKIVREHLNEDGLFLINVIAIPEGDNLLAKSIFSDLKKVFGDILIFRNPKYPLNEWDNTFFLASKGKLEIKERPKDDFLAKIVDKAFKYQGTFNWENTDNFVRIEKESLKIRQLYFDFAKEKIKGVI